MKVSDLAKNLEIPVDQILATLKSLKLKAKDKDQELSAAVVSVIKSELVKSKSSSKKSDESKPKKKTEEKKETKEAKEEKVEKPKKISKPKEEKKEAPAKKEEPKPASVQVKKEAPVVKAPEPPTVKKDILKPKPKISKEPVITLKPLLRKKKKSGPEQRPFMGGAFTREASPSASTAISSTPTTQDAQAPAGPLTDIEIDVPITVKNLSVKLQQKPSVILTYLMKLGILAHINQSLDGELVTKIARDFGFNLVKTRTQEEQLIAGHKKEDEDPKLLKPRSPVVTFMGHVDHGKTSLLDKIRKSKVADSEHGGITQHIGAYSVPTQKGRITFLDTPGHEAFTAMRARGAHITDIVVLVIAADEGIMPQTEEAIAHARAANVPIIVALNKVDKKTADIDRVKKQLMEVDLMPEDWGGKTVAVGVSAMTGQGIDTLLEMILLESELLELKANPNKRASGIIVEAHLSRGRGVVTTLIIQGGTLKENDFITVGPHYGKIKAMFDDHERSIKEAGPSMPVEILGLPEVPEAGENFYIVEDERVAREITAQRAEQLKNERLNATKKISLEDLYAQIQKGVIKELPVILKADVQGSAEAIKDSLEKIPSDKVKIKFIHIGVGDINASDVLLAVASKAIIIGFHVDIDVRARQELEKQPVDVRQYRIIYDAVNDMKNALEGLLEAKTRKKFMSRIEIREVFKLSKSGIVAGCYVQKGRVLRKAHVDVMRNSEIIHTGTISSLKRFKDDVKDVTEGMECGITVSGFDKYEPGDILEAYELESIAQKL